MNNNNNNNIICGDALTELQKLDGDSIDLIATDPPYFLINDSGKGFMSKEWDSVGVTTGYHTICKSKEFATFVLRFFTSMKVRLETDAQEADSVQTYVLTTQEVSDLLSELSLNPTTVKENLQENALYVIPLSYIKSQLTGIVPESVLRFPIEAECEGREILVSSTDAARISGVIEGMAGSILGLKSTSEINTPANSAENIATPKKYKRIILSNTNKHKITRWIIWLLYVLNVMQRRNTIPNSYTINYDLIYQFHKAWASQAVRVLKAGAFAFVMSAPRSDVLSIMVQALKDAGFVIAFSPLYHTFASGFPKAADVSKLVDKRNGKPRPVRVIELEEYLKSKIKERYQNHHELAKEMAIDESCIRRWTGRHLDYSVAAFIPPKNRYETLKQKLGLDDRFDKLIEREEAERERLGVERYRTTNNWTPTSKDSNTYITKPVTEQAKALEGAYAGFQPKPAVEVVLVVMKPLSEKSYVDQALQNGKGITWLDGCRIPYQSDNDADQSGWQHYNQNKGLHSWNELKVREGDRKETVLPRSNRIQDLSANQKGRFPANLLVSDDVLNDGKITKSSGGFVGGEIGGTVYGRYDKVIRAGSGGYNDSGSFSRYFDLDRWFDTTFPFLITPKASKAEKDMGLDKWIPQTTTDGRAKPLDNPFQRGETLRNNVHPTVKPLKLMSYLIMLGSRPNEIVLDPFCGSGTTCIAAKMLKRQCIGIELNQEYMNIANARLAALQEDEQPTLFEIVTS